MPPPATLPQKKKKPATKVALKPSTIPLAERDPVMATQRDLLMKMPMWKLKKHMKYLSASVPCNAKCFPNA